MDRRCVTLITLSQDRFPRNRLRVIGGQVRKLITFSLTKHLAAIIVSEFYIPAKAADTMLFNISWGKHANETFTKLNRLAITSLSLGIVTLLSSEH